MFLEYGDPSRLKVQRLKRLLKPGGASCFMWPGDGISEEGFLGWKEGRKEGKRLFEVARLPMRENHLAARLPAR